MLTIRYVFHHRVFGALAAILGLMNAQYSTAATDAFPGVAVVELFTSQGCSSCPPGERVLANLNNATAKDGRPIFTLAFHVDYWNRLGWRDPFSDAAFSARQQHYAELMKLNSVYTPQAVVNGKQEFVGSDAAHMAAEVKRGLAEAQTAPVMIKSITPKDQSFRVAYTASHVTNDIRLNVAIAERGLSTSITRGENAGRVLEEPSVVRWFTTVDANSSGEIVIALPSDVRADHATVVLYTQRVSDGAIVGATASPLR